MTPTVGRIVQYNDNGVWSAALVTGVEPFGLWLSVFYPRRDGANGLLFPVSEGNREGCWRWPPREEAPTAPAGHDAGNLHVNAPIDPKKVSR